MDDVPLDLRALRVTESIIKCIAIGAMFKREKIEKSIEETIASPFEFSFTWVFWTFENRNYH